MSPLVLWAKLLFTRFYHSHCFFSLVLFHYFISTAPLHVLEKHSLWFSVYSGLRLPRALPFVSSICWNGIFFFLFYWRCDVTVVAVFETVAACQHPSSILPLRRRFWRSASWGIVSRAELANWKVSPFVRLSLRIPFFFCLLASFLFLRGSSLPGLSSWESFLFPRYCAFQFTKVACTRALAVLMATTAWNRWLARCDVVFPWVAFAVQSACLCSSERNLKRFSSLGEFSSSKCLAHTAISCCVCFAFFSLFFFFFFIFLGWGGANTFNHFV